MSYYGGTAGNANMNFVSYRTYEAGPFPVRDMTHHYNQQHLESDLSDLIEPKNNYVYSTHTPMSSINDGDESTMDEMDYFNVTSTSFRRGSAPGKVLQAADSSSVTPPAIYGTVSSGSKKHRNVDVQNRHRKAANIRERRRMQSINVAFDKLRHRIPTLQYEKRLSKVDTLRLAIGYIKFLQELLTTSSVPGSTAQSGDGSGGRAAVQREEVPEPPPKKKIIIQCHTLDQSWDQDVHGVRPLVGHSLSWNRITLGASPNSKNFLKTKVWTPFAASTSGNDQPPALRPDQPAIFQNLDTKLNLTNKHK